MAKSNKPKFIIFILLKLSRVDLYSFLFSFLFKFFYTLYSFDLEESTLGQVPPNFYFFSFASADSFVAQNQTAVFPRSLILYFSFCKPTLVSWHNIYFINWPQHISLVLSLPSLPCSLCSVLNNLFRPILNIQQYSDLYSSSFKKSF